MHGVRSLGPERQLTAELDDQAVDHQWVWLVHGSVLSGQKVAGAATQDRVARWELTGPARAQAVQQVPTTKEPGAPSKRSMSNGLVMSIRAPPSVLSSGTALT